MSTLTHLNFGPIQIHFIMTNPADIKVEIITPIGMLGYGYPIDPFLAECRRMPPGSFIIADAGSTDSYVISLQLVRSTILSYVYCRGPQKLCFGITTAPRDGYLRDMRPILEIANERGFKVLFGSSGGHGSNSHVELFADIVDQICREEGYSFRVATILSEVDKELIKSHITNGTLTPCGPVPELTTDEVDKTPRIVGQMGVEPFIKALEGGAQVVLAGETLTFSRSA